MNGYARDEIEAFLLQKLDVDGVAVDSQKLDGLTRDEIVSSIETIAGDTYVTNQQITVLTNNLTTSFEDGMWALNGGNVIKLQEGSVNGIFTQTTDRIFDLDGGPSNRWIAVGSNGLMGYSTDNGVNWTPVTSGVTKDIAFVRYLTGLTWVFVTIDGDVYRTTDGGINWTPVTAFGQSVTSVDNIGASYVVVVGATGLVESNDGGATWETPVDLSTLPTISDAALTQSQEVYLATASGLYVWSGLGTEALVNGVPNTEQIDHVEVDFNGHIVAVETGGLHHRYSAANGAWQQIEHIRQIKELVVDKYNLWVALTLDNRLLRSVDGGRFWSAVPTTPADVLLWSIGSGEGGWLTGGDSGELYLSID